MGFVKFKNRLRRKTTMLWLNILFLKYYTLMAFTSASITRAASFCAEVSNIDRRDTPNGRCAIYSAHDAADAVHLRPQAKASAPHFGPHQLRASLRPMTRQPTTNSSPARWHFGTRTSAHHASESRYIMHE